MVDFWMVGTVEETDQEFMTGMKMKEARPFFRYDGTLYPNEESARVKAIDMAAANPTKRIFVVASIASVKADVPMVWQENK